MSLHDSRHLSEFALIVCELLCREGLFSFQGPFSIAVISIIRSHLAGPLPHPSVPPTLPLNALSWRLLRDVRYSN